MSTELRESAWDLDDELAELREAGFYRELRRIEATDGPHLTMDGRSYLNLASNNYLGLTRHPRVIAAAASALREYGAGAGASRLISGHLGVHDEL